MMKILVENILPNPEQPRLEFSETELQGLAESIRAVGMINAIAVEDQGDGSYILIDGERRLRASKRLGLKEIEATVLPSRSGSNDRLTMALVANLQRSDLNPVEEGRSYKKLKAMGLSNAAIANRTGASLARVVGRMKLLEMPAEVQDLYAARKLPLDQRAIEALARVEHREDRIALARRLARPGVTAKTVIRACEHYEALKGAEFIPSDTPAIEIARHRRGFRNASTPAWSLLAKLGVIPAWAMVEKAAKAMCAKCALAAEASDQVCKNCGGVELVLGMMELANERL